MKVYVVDFEDVVNDEDFILKVFDSKEGAENYIMQDIEKQYGEYEPDINKSEWCISVSNDDEDIHTNYYICEHELNKA